LHFCVTLVHAVFRLSVHKSISHCRLDYLFIDLLVYCIYCRDYLPLIIKICYMRICHLTCDSLCVRILCIYSSIVCTLSGRLSIKPRNLQRIQFQLVDSMLFGHVRSAVFFCHCRNIFHGHSAPYPSQENLAVRL